MSIRHLKTLIAVVEHGSLAEAAEALALTQSAVSMQIRALEEQLGARLFNRDFKPLRPTPQGEAVFQRAREVVTQYEQLWEVSGSGDALAGSLAVGAIPTALGSVLPRALANLRAAHARLQVRVVSGVSQSLVLQLARGELDAAVISEPGRLPERLKWTPFAREPIMVLAPPGTRCRDDARLLRSLPYIRYNLTTAASG